MHYEEPYRMVVLNSRECTAEGFGLSCPKNIIPIQNSFFFSRQLSSTLLKVH